MDWKEINYDEVTLYDCQRLFDLKGIRTVINDGHVVGFELEGEERD